MCCMLMVERKHTPLSGLLKDKSSEVYKVKKLLKFNIRGIETHRANFIMPLLINHK